MTASRGLHRSLLATVTLAALAVVIGSAQTGRSDADTGVRDARARMRTLAPLVGAFELTAIETATNDSSFEESGSRHCRWTIGDSVILCEDARTLLKAVGRYQQLPANRRSLRIYRWNAVDRTFEQVDIGASGVPQVRALGFDADRSTLSYRSEVQSQSRGETLDNSSVLTMGSDRHQLTQVLRSRTSSFQEEYRETAARRPVRERVVFASERGGNTDIYLANEDGSGLRRLTYDAAPDLVPRCSPDGRHVVFLRGGFSASGEIYRLDLMTGEERRLTNDTVRDSTPQWSADGRQIYFTKRLAQHDRIAVMNADGTAVRFLTDGRAWHDTMPGVSPDARTLVHHTYRYGSETELHLLDTVSEASRRLTDAPGSDYEASFAGPDHVLFSSNRDGGHYRLYLMSVADNRVRQLADTGTNIWGSRYSSRSNAVVFHTGAEESWRLMRVDLAGGSATPFLADGFSNSSADWCVAGP